MTLFRYQLVKVNGSFQRALGVQVGVDAVKVREFPLNLQKENALFIFSLLSLFVVFKFVCCFYFLVYLICLFLISGLPLTFQNPNDIVFTCDLHLEIPNNMIEIIRKVQSFFEV